MNVTRDVQTLRQELLVARNSIDAALYALQFMDPSATVTLNVGRRKAAEDVTAHAEFPGIECCQMCEGGPSLCWPTWMGMC